MMVRTYLWVVRKVWSSCKGQAMGEVLVFDVALESRNRDVLLEHML